jgi:hypothetical protein
MLQAEGAANDDRDIPPNNVDRGATDAWKGHRSYQIDGHSFIERDDA